MSLIHLRENRLLEKKTGENEPFRKSLCSQPPQTVLAIHRALGETMKRPVTGRKEKGYFQIRDLQRMGVRAIIIPILRPSRIGEKRATALALFRNAPTVQAKKEMVIEWNLLNPGHEVSLASLYRWDRKERMSTMKYDETAGLAQTETGEEGRIPLRF